MSILVPSQDQLTQRSVKVEKSFQLLDWFQASEFQAWKMVDIYHPSLSPNTIFLVMGQVLTNEFHIGHKWHANAPCEVRISSDLEIPNEPDIRTLQSFGIQTVTPGIGFEKCRRKLEGNAESFSIVLDWYPSARVRRFRLQESFSVPLESIFRADPFQVSTNTIECSKILPFPSQIQSLLRTTPRNRRNRSHRPVRSQTTSATWLTWTKFHSWKTAFANVSQITKP
jgi:hypothetical protein